MIAKCVFCGSKFVRKIKRGNKRIYCSANCKVLFWREKNLKKWEKIKQKINQSESRKQYLNEWRLKNRSRLRVYGRKYDISKIKTKCIECGKEFNPNSNYQPHQKYCSVECRMKPAYKKYKKTFKAKIKQLRENNSRRSYRHFIKFRWQEAKCIIVRDKVCVYCGAEGTTFDHIVPISRNGTTEYSNLVLSCKSCNSSKRDKDVHSWCIKHKIAVPKIIIELMIMSKRIQTLTEIFGIKFIENKGISSDGMYLLNSKTIGRGLWGSEKTIIIYNFERKGKVPYYKFPRTRRERLIRKKYGRGRIKYFKNLIKYKIQIIDIANQREFWSEELDEIPNEVYKILKCRKHPPPLGANYVTNPIK